MSNVIFILLPMIPFITRSILFIKYFSKMGGQITNEEKDRESHRSYILPLAGFSFAGLIGLIVVDASKLIHYSYPIYYIFLSFIFFIFSANLQSYKSRLWEDQIATGCIDIANFCLILCIISLLFAAHIDKTMTYTLAVIAFILWLFDHIMRMIFEFSYYHEKEIQK
ncbi:MAG: hypothetical protein ABSF88_09945 [Candidatus Aminicenantales bacterium]